MTETGQVRQHPLWRATMVTLFPELFPGPLAASLVGKALERGLWALETVAIRDFATDRHATVDGQPFGGGPGMVLRPDIVDAAIGLAVAAHRGEAAAAQGSATVDPPPPILYLSPRGRPLDQAGVRALADGPGAIVLCGRYEGVDERVIEAWEMTEISLGDFVLSGGEIAAMAMLDAVVRLLPGVVGEAASLAEESFEGGLLEYPQFTRPDAWTDRHGLVRRVPEVLTSGHHGAIAEWRRRMAEQVTEARRPDLWERYCREKQRAKED